MAFVKWIDRAKAGTILTWPVFGSRGVAREDVSGTLVDEI